MIVAAYINNFLAEDYKRHQQRVTLAAALAGEMGSHALSFPLLKNILIVLLDAAEKGKTLEFPKGMAVPDDPIYESAVTQLGVLGADLTRDVVFVYQNIRAGRMAFFGVCNSDKELTPSLVIGALNSSLLCLRRAEEKSDLLLQALTKLCQENYQIRRGAIRLEVKSSRKSNWNQNDQC